MPRGKKRNVEFIENIDEKITVVSNELEDLKVQIKDKKQELKKLIKAKADNERIAAEKKAAEEKEKVIAAVTSAIEKGEKTVDEILEYLN